MDMDVTLDAKNVKAAPYLPVQGDHLQCEGR
jgi:hypothetical protein